ncbi:MAG: AAA family ATPase, partial [Gammaproteobacteria bacterium]|nr:AAA family ATPase [Gammaproteobacteria bacterium]
MDQRPPPVDEDQRRRVRTELRTSFLVEAGAGSGKTTLLVDRMVALVESGEAEVARIAAVTFTRKAAAELR